jgi:phage tail-like protein
VVSESQRARGIVPELASPVPVLQRLPGVLQDDEFLQRLTSAFDDSFAPIFATLDSLSCYFDPWLAPPDFLVFLATWVGVELDDSWDEDRRRRIIAGAALLHRRRGTARGIKEALKVGLGVEVDVQDSGGCAWSRTPGGTPPGVSPAQVAVRIRTPDPDALDRRRVDALLEAIKPAHVKHSCVVAATEGAS